MELPKELNRFAYYGRGPVNNYRDRKTGQFVEEHHGLVGEQDIMLPKPQSMGNREDVRWCALTDAQGNGAAFVADGLMSASALPWSALELMGAAHPYQLPASTATHLHLDAKVAGLGGNSCGQGGPLKPDCVPGEGYRFGFLIRPVTNGQTAAVTKVAPAGEHPIAMVRDINGLLTFTTPYAKRAIVYRVNGGKPQEYKAPVNLREGGKVEAWYKDNKAAVATQTFHKIENVPLSVLFCSSQETGDNGIEHAVDNDPSTFWHTMYSVTVAQYPHWVDFDANGTKLMKGFVYVPRQDGTNGRIKDYEIYVSQDGKEWGLPIAKGTFPNDTKQQRIDFAQPVRARYIRFKALSSQNGQDFASAAEFKLIAD